MISLDRRRTLGVSAFALAVLAGLRPDGAARAEANGADAGFLNLALGFEHKGIAAYAIAAGSGLLSTNSMLIAAEFRGHHEQHRDALVKALRELGAVPVEALAQKDYATAIKADLLRNENQIYELALDMEKKAADAYIGAIATFTDRGHATLAAKIAADEAMHWTTWAGFLGRKLPAEAFTFGPA